MENIKVPEKFKDLVEKIEKLSALDLAELVKVLEQKFGVSAAPAFMVSGGGPGGTSASPATSAQAAEEKTAFNVVLKDAGSQKIQVIKVVRELTQKGLKESKDLVDAIPQVVAEGIKKEQAEEMKKKFEEVGATAEIQ